VSDGARAQDLDDLAFWRALMTFPSNLRTLSGVLIGSVTIPKPSRLTRWHAFSRAL
jgi:hypothetical protein